MLSFMRAFFMPLKISPFLLIVIYPLLVLVFHIYRELPSTFAGLAHLDLIVQMQSYPYNMVLTPCLDNYQNDIYFLSAG